MLGKMLNTPENIPTKLDVAVFSLLEKIPGTIFNINLSQITLFIHGETTMLISN